MDNYKQKLFLLCALLFGCVLTSIGVEYFAEPDEPIQIQAPQFVEQQSKTKSNLQFSVEQPQITSNLKFLEEQHKTRDNKQYFATININTATIEELDTLPGVGPAIAKRIVEFRSTEPFTKPEDIMLVKGIGKKKFAKMRERITVE